MDTSQFWHLIQNARAAVPQTRDMPNWLTSYLQEQPLEEIVGFRQRYNELYSKAYDLRLWAAAHLMRGGMCSHDKFTDFLAWLIGKGEAVYESALNDPDTLADVDDTDGDDDSPSLFYLPSAAPRAYKQKVGDKLAAFPVTFKVPKLQNEDFWE